MNEDMHRFVPPTWTWSQAAELFEMNEVDLREWVERENAKAREAGRLEPIVVSTDGRSVTWVGSPTSD